MTRRTVAVGSFLLLVAVLVEAGSSGRAAAAPVTPGTGALHPRVQFAPGDEAMLRDRLSREPYRTVFLTMHGRAAQFDQRPLGDMTIVVQRDLSRAAKIFAFEYALDRTVIGGEIVPFPDAAARQALGDRVEALLLNLYPRSRFAVPAPLGGLDRDINTSEEMINYGTAFDTMLGAAYDFGPERAAIVDLLVAVTGELHENYVNPASANNAALLNQNNHRSKSGAAMAVVAVVLADERPDEARAWFDDGAVLVDDVDRYILMAGDGAYGEGPYYLRYTMQNLVPFHAVWDRFLGDGAWTVGDVVVPAPARHPLFRRTLRWMMDMTLPDGSMAAIDDGNPGRSFYFGAMPADVPDAAAGYWRWRDTPQPFETDGSVELGPDTIVAYDDGIVPAPPTWSPTAFYIEGGDAILRTDWSKDATVAIVVGEHDTAAEFGRDRDGLGRWPQSHEHADPGSFLLNAFGQRLALDPGYLTFTTRTKVNKPEHHNMVLVDGAGPPDYGVASINWRNDLVARPPAEGMATLHHTLDAVGMRATSVVAEYRDTRVDRRVLLGDERYLVVADAVAGPGTTVSWPLHGNGGGTSGGSFAATATGGRWEIGGARLDRGVGAVGQVPTLTTADAIHEVPYGQERTHTVQQASVAGGTADAVQLLYPSATGSAPPVIERFDEPGQVRLVLTDAAEDRRITVTRVGGTAAGMTVVDEHLDGRLRMLYGDGVDHLEHGAISIRASSPGTLGLRIGDDGTVSMVADTADPTGRTAVVAGLGTPVAVDGACAVSGDGGEHTITMGRDGRAIWRPAGPGPSPAADAGRDRAVAAGTDVVLDGAASCGGSGALVPSWELVSAPPGSAWSLTGTTTFAPVLTADRVGPYRMRLTVTDAAGRVSLVDEVVVIAGPRGGDGVDNDLDGLLDTDDPDGDGPAEPEPTTTTTPTTTATTATLPPTTVSPTTRASTAPPTSGVAPAVVATPRFTA